MSDIRVDKCIIHPPIPSFVAMDEQEPLKYAKWALKKALEEDDLYKAIVLAARAHSSLYQAWLDEQPKD